MNLSQTTFLVEDDDDDQELFLMALREITDATLFAIANNGREAIERLQKAPTLPAVIFMDIQMPIMDGMECLSKMANDPLMNAIPVVMLSSEIRLKDRALQLGAMAFIKKPNNSLTLCRELEEIFTKLRRTT
jgi:CheY-like chemotaxis protein